MDDDPAPADDERAIELSSIAAIFPELVLDPASPYRASLELGVAPALPLKIHFQQSADATAPHFLPTPPTSLDTHDEGEKGIANPPKVAQVDNNAPDVHHLAHLPPLSLGIELPLGYPAEKSPILSISTSPAWLPKSRIRKLLADGPRLWEEIGRDQVIFTYIDHLQQKADEGFDMAENLDGSIALPRDLKIALLDFDIKAKREAFEKETFECGVCLEPKKGTVCHRLLLCSHVFCVGCLQAFYNNCISEGDVENVKCLAPDCGKDTRPTPAQDQTDSARKRKRKQDRTISPSELLQIPLTQDTVQRYVHLKRKKQLESDKNTVYCPRKWCQGAARSKKHPKPDGTFTDDADLESESEGEEQVDQSNSKDKKERKLPPMAERLSVCEDCSYAFCSVCKKGWHGELARCDPRKEAELSAEEKASQEYMALHTTPCPTCSAPCQKSMGCNHMICFKCRTHFCYLCSSYLMEGNPYQHFNDTKSACYMRLWELEGGDGGEDVGIHFAGGAMDDWDVTDSSDGEDSADGVEDGDFSDSDPDDSDDARAPHPRNVRGAPPPAPNPPRQAPGQARNRARGDARAPQNQAVVVEFVEDRPARRPAAAVAPAVVLPPAAAAAPGQGNYGAQQPAPVRAMGLERFLELAQQDREEEWDSDELDDIDGPEGGRAGAWN